MQAILQKLDEAYPNVTCALVHENAFQLLISTILSAQCTDERVNRVTKTLFQKYRTPKDFAYANPAELEQDIRPTGFFRNKTKSIMGAGKKIVEEFGGEVPRTMDELLTLPGVARKTANVVLGTAFGIAVGVVVDTHVTRLSNRLDLSRNTDPKKIEQDLMQVIPPEQMDLIFSPADLARPQSLPGAQTQMRRMQPRNALLRERQDRIAYFSHEGHLRGCPLRRIRSHPSWTPRARLDIVPSCSSCRERRSKLTSPGSSIRNIKSMDFPCISPCERFMPSIRRESWTSAAANMFRPDVWHLRPPTSPGGQLSLVGIGQGKLFRRVQ